MGGRRRTGDHFSRRARKENFPARSVYKLQEIDQRTSLIKPGFKILDLGAAPGSWTLYASKAVGPSGKVVAVDRADLTIGVPANVTALNADALAVDPEEVKALVGGSGFDVVISDMAPRTSGHRFTDQSRSFALFCRALELAGDLCRPGGGFVGKIFQGEDFEEARAKTRDLYNKVRIVRPKSVRTESYETYIVGLSRKTPVNPT